MISSGAGSVSQISPLEGKTTIDGDRDRNGTAEITACFTNVAMSVSFKASIDDWINAAVGGDMPGEPDETQVQVTITEKKDRTVIALAHSGVGSGKKWAATVDQVTEVEDLQNSFV